MRRCIIVDVDGTLVDVSGIRHYVKLANGREYKDFESFHKAAAFMPAIEETKKILHAFDFMLDVDIFVVTARQAKWERETRAWLRNNGVRYDALCMRATGDRRPDVEVKRDILSRIRETHRPLFAIDDNPSIIALWQSERIPTYVIPGWED